jgi:Zn-dependent peptidase ImmA (M78 family)/DNA-binding XRE family transcriptional regulator
MAGLSLQELADKMNNIITKQALNKYEHDLMKPDSKVLITLANALEVSVDYFFQPFTVELQDIAFRKRSSLSKKSEESIKEKVRNHLERYLEIENILGISSEFKNLVEDIPVQSAKDAAEVAEKLRTKWKLGIDAVPNLIELLEEKEIKIIHFEAAADFDGFQASAGEIKAIVLNTSSGDTARRRFTAAHELGHLVMNIDKTIPDRDQEIFCMAFAGAFLLSKEKMIAEFGRQRTRISIGELIAMKKLYGVSVQAIMRRLKDLEIISDSYYKNFCIRIRQTGNYKEQNWKYEGIDEPQRFYKLLYRAASEEIITMSKAASLANYTLAKFKEAMEPTS